MKSGIYQIKNLVNGKIYVGSASTLRNRKCNHFSDLRDNKHPNARLQNSYNKYGRSNFEFSIIEYCSKDKLVEREQHYIDTLDPYFNIRRIANSNLGFKFTEESKLKMSLAQTGKVLSEEHREAIRASTPSRKILQYSLTGEFIKEWSSVRSIGRDCGFSHSGVSRACKLGKVLYGCIWKYKD